MSLEQAILEALRALPAEQQQEILHHATSLRAQTTGKRPLRSVKGLWADLGTSLSAEELKENQREMWEQLPAERHLMPAVAVDTHAIVPISDANPETRRRRKP